MYSSPLPGAEYAVTTWAWIQGAARLSEVSEGPYCLRLPRLWFRSKQRTLSLALPPNQQRTPSDVHAQAARAHAWRQHAPAPSLPPPTPRSPCTRRRAGL